MQLPIVTVVKINRNSTTEVTQRDLRIIAFSDTSFANYEKLRIQLEYVILLTDNTQRTRWLLYASIKCDLYVRSVFGEKKNYSMADCLDAAFMIKHDLKNITGLRIPIMLLTKSERLFKIIVKSTSTTKKKGL